MGQPPKQNPDMLVILSEAKNPLMNCRKLLSTDLQGILHFAIIAVAIIGSVQNDLLLLNFFQK